VLWDHDFSGENNRDLARLHVDRGLAYMELERPEKALAEYDEAIGIFPLLTEAYANRAVVRALLGMEAEAE
jgi:tetratricopeptide (TPR) repeat protein